MQIALPPDLEGFVGDLVSTGSYATPSEVVLEALRLLKERDEIRAIRLERLRSEIQFGIDQIDRGECAPLDISATKAEARRRAAERSCRNGAE